MADNRPPAGLVHGIWPASPANASVSRLREDRYCKALAYRCQHLFVIFYEQLT